MEVGRWKIEVGSRKRGVGDLMVVPENVIATSGPSHPCVPKPGAHKGTYRTKYQEQVKRNQTKGIVTLTKEGSYQYIPGNI